MRAWILMAYGLVGWLFATMTEAGVLSIDPAGSGSFTTIQSAVDAAVDGDVLLVAAADYSAGTGFVPGVIVNGKSLTLVASPAGGSFALGALEVKNLSALQRVVVRGLIVTGTPVVFAPVVMNGGTRVSACAGAVVFEDCGLTGPAAGHLFNSTFPGTPGLSVVDAASVVMTRCTLTGGLGIVEEGMFGHKADGYGGLVAKNSVVVASESVFTGGANWTFPVTGLGAGGPGVAVTTGTFAASGCSLTGGAGLHATSGQPGPGLVLANAASTALLFDTTTTGGASPNGPGPGIVAGAGTVHVAAGTSRSLAVTSPAHPADPVTVDLVGVQNDLVLFFFSTTGGFITIGGLDGVLAMGLPAQGPFVLASITAPSGQASFVVPAPPLVPGVAGFTFVLHPIFVNGSSAVAGAPSSFTLVQ